MIAADALLVRILAAEDAIRLPVRNWNMKTPTNRYLRGLDLAGLGVSFRLAAEDAAAAVKTSRELMKLHDSGLLVVTRRAKVKYPHVRLSDKGDVRTRALCGLPGREVARSFLAHAIEMGARFDASYDGTRWVPEIWFQPAGKRDWTQRDKWELAGIELDYLPGARLGWVDCCSSIHGVAAYAATPEGIAELKNPSAAPNFGNLPAFDKAAGKLYRKEQDSALVALANDTPTKPNELGEMPAIHCMMFTQPTEAKT